MFYSGTSNTINTNKTRQQNHWLQNLANARTHSVTKPHNCILYNAHDKGRQQMLVFERESFQLRSFCLVHLFTIYNSEPNSDNQSDLTHVMPSCSGAFHAQLITASTRDAQTRAFDLTMPYPGGGGGFITGHSHWSITSFLIYILVLTFVFVFFALTF